MTTAIRDLDFYGQSLSYKFSLIEKELIEVAGRCKAAEEKNTKWHNQLSDKAKALIQERRTTREGGGRSMKDISKELQKEMRAWERIRKRHAIEKILL